MFSVVDNARGYAREMQAQTGRSFVLLWRRAGPREEIMVQPLPLHPCLLPLLARNGGPWIELGPNLQERNA